MSDQISDNKRQAAALVGLVAVGAAVILGGIGLLVLGWPGLLVGVVLTAILVVVAVRAATGVVAGRVGGAPADPVEHARFHNVVDGLCIAGGLPKPDLVVVDDAAPNALAYGRSPRQAGLVVTAGLLDQMTRIELEGVLAHELSHIKSLDILPATLAAAFSATALGWPRGAAEGGHEALADLQAVGLTRYPPGLLSALEKLQSDETEMRPRSSTIAHLWLKRPKTGSRPAPPLDERIETLREL